MFQRRLLLLLAAAVGVAMAIGAQAAWLTMGPPHAKYRRQAEQALRTFEYIPTVRGQILDREGRVLARTEAGWDVKVQYSVITGDWAYEQARGEAREQAGHRWRQLSSDQQQRLIDQHLPAYRRRADELWQTLTRWRQEDRAQFTRAQLDQTLSRIEQRVHGVASHLWSLWHKRREAELDEQVPLSEVAKPIAEQTQAHVVLADVTAKVREKVHHQRTLARQGKAPAIWLQVKLDRPKRRRYPWEEVTLTLDSSTLPTPIRKDRPIKVQVRGVASHLLGKMRDIWKSDLEGEDARPFHYQNDAGQTMTNLAGYRAGDRIGAFGIEQAYERRLRGTRGKDVHHLGRDEDVPDKIEIKPTPGNDVRSTLDIKLQARIQAIMSPATGLMQTQPWHVRNEKEKARLGRPLTGAAVVLDVDTSEVLAAVSTPSMPRQTMRRHPEQIFKDPFRLPYLNRPIARAYPPGSTIKPMMLVAAASAGDYNVGEKIFCRGYLHEGQPNRYRCWIWKNYNTGHGNLDAAASIERSCNVFYYTLGQRMDPQDQVQWFNRFGLGRDSAVALGDEVTGSLPAPENEPTAADQRNAIFMGIGQGPVSWTPLQAAAAYATMARRGQKLGPTFVKPKDRLKPRKSRWLDLDSAAVGKAMHGLYEVVNGDKGTGRQLHLDDPEPIFNAEHLRIFGKSGTADAGNRWIDKNLNQKVDEGEVMVDAGDHAWFMAMPQAESAERPPYVIAVVVEYGGSGSQVAGPIANQIIHALIEEGYLPPATEQGGAA
jgi:cell division protein FtsI/penicillin-binding protein 2